MGLPLFQSPSQVKGDVSISSAEKVARHDRSAIRRSAPPPRRRGGTASANSSSRDRDAFPNYFSRDLFTQEHLDIIAAEARDNARDLEALIERSDPALVPERRRETLRELARSMNWDTGSIRNTDTFGRVRLRSPSQPVREEAADDNSFLVGTGLEDDDVPTTGHTQIRRAIYNWTSRGGDRRPLVSQPSLTYRTIMSGTAPQHQPSRRRFAHAARRGGSAPYPFSRMARTRANEEREARALFSHDGLGDRNRSLSPESGVWDTLLTTLTPDPQPPSVGSSFASTVASQSAGESASTSFTEPDLAFGNTPEMAVATDPGCESAGEEHDTSEEEDDANIEVALSSGFRRHIPRSHPTHRSFPLPATSSGTDLREMLQFVRSLAARDDLPAGFWAEAGLSRREGSG